MPQPCCDDCRWLGGLARDHARRLAAIARREGVAPTDALDVVQDAFVTLLRRPDAEALRDKPADAVRVLSAIVRNAARNLRRRHHHARPHVELTDGDLATPAVVAAGDAAQLASCMAELGATQRNVVTLRVLEELSGDEAAATLGLTPGHVAVLLHRARKQLESCMLAAG